MANYIESARSNFFRVKNKELFEFAMDSCGVSYIHKEDRNGDHHFGIFEDECGEGGLPTNVYFEDEDVKVCKIEFNLDGETISIIAEIPYDEDSGKQLSMNDVKENIPDEISDLVVSFEEANFIEDNEMELDVAGEVSRHLQDGAVAVFMYSGSEKMRYISGGAYSVDNKGNSAHVDLEDIYNLAAEKMGVPIDSIPRCEYECILEVDNSNDILGNT